jgi:hypothetical protein
MTYGVVAVLGINVYGNTPCTSSPPSNAILLLAFT